MTSLLCTLNKKNVEKYIYCSVLSILLYTFCSAPQEPLEAVKVSKVLSQLSWKASVVLFQTYLLFYRECTFH